ncbi:taste receptor type 2 member 1-like [Hyla sarda]|uniref:taste receptor type 2 member 1-like n=1 Tax=Hyla sarda TaxID=327740 RepID=UPI0024C3D315|nr:taste receptor type 2 member 1-like [Hyla sarda]
MKHTKGLHKNKWKKTNHTGTSTEEMKSTCNASNETNWDNDIAGSIPPSSSTTTLTTWQVLSLGILVIESIVGTFMNGLMVTINLINLLTQRKLNSCDSVLTCLGLSRLTFMSLLLVIYFVSYLAPNDTSLATNLQYSWLFFSNISLWLATWLSAFYCVRIVNIQIHIFTAFKTHFDRLLPFLVLTSIAISVSCCNSTAYSGASQTFDVSKFQKKDNSTPFAAFGNNFGTFMTLSIAGSIPPFFLFCVSTGLVVGSLVKHMKKMKEQERTGFREPSLDAHYRAVKMMAAFFIFFSLYLMAFILYGSGQLDDDMLSCMAAFLIGAYPSLHSILLVIGNHKLKHALVAILQKGHFYQKEVIQTISD